MMIAPGGRFWPGSARRLPTTDLYFGDAMADRIGGWRRPRAPICAIGPNSFIAGDRFLLVRRDRPQLMARALAWPGTLVYMIDDDIAGAADSPNLPRDYQQRLAAFDAAWHQPLVKRADILIVPSAVLAARLGKRSDAPIYRLDPWWREPLANQTHFAALAQGAPLRIAHLGSASHQAGLTALVPALTALMADHPATRFTYLAPAPLLGAIDADHRVSRVAPLRWPAYRRWLRCQRFHLALYPLTDSRFDRARSANKLHEHATCGAVGVYPQAWEPARALGPGAAILAPACAADWANTLAKLPARRGELAQIAAAAAKSLSCHDNRASQRGLWSQILCLAAN